MKRLIIMFLEIGITMFVYSCSEQSPTAPGLNQNDQSAISLDKRVRTPFEGISTFVGDIDLGSAVVLPNGIIKITGQIAEWKEETDCPMVNGQSIWYIDWLIDSDWSRAKFGGTADINVGVEKKAILY